MRSFRAWAKKAKITNDAVGDFIADARRDESFPKQVKTVAGLKRYLRARDACDNAIEAAEKVWSGYMAERRSAANGRGPRQ
jgi:hypothetical protein